MSNAGIRFNDIDWKLPAVLSLSLLVIAVAILFPPGGHFMVDEGAYHMMVRDFAGFRNFSLWNGYEEFPSAELSFPVLRDHQGRLVSQYPEIYTLLAFPFYLAFGYDGLFLLNALGLAGIVWLTFWMARRLFGSQTLALNACLILLLATYAWEYSLATMPHILAALFAMTAVSLTLLAMEQISYRRSLLLALGAGCVVGLGAGIRLDAFFVVPAIVVPYLFLSPWRPWHAVLCAIGTAPWLALYTVLNQIKFGIPSPFSYGAGQPEEVSGIGSYLLIAATGVLALTAARIAMLPWGRRQIRERRNIILIGLGLVLAMGLISDSGRTLGSRFLEGFYQLVVDLRIRDLSLHEGGLARGPGGSMVYLGAVKKSLLQSCPYLVILTIPLIHLLRQNVHRLALALLFLITVSYIGILSYFAAHGGPGLNLRYLVAVLPYTSILAAYAWREVTRGMPAPWGRVALFTAIGFAAFYFFGVGSRHIDLALQELIYLTVPLGLACGLLSLTVLYLAGNEKRKVAIRGPAAVAITVTMVWAGIVAFTHDLPRSYELRKMRAELSRSIAPHIAPDSLLIGFSVGSFFGLLEHGRVRLATPVFDDFQDFDALVAFHLESKLPVYVWVDRFWSKEIRNRGLERHLVTVPIWEHELGRLERVVGLADG